MGRKKYSKELKNQIALDAIKGQKTIAELASEYGVHANQISTWKKQLLDAANAAFRSGKDKDSEQKEVERDHLYQKVGQLQIEVGCPNLTNTPIGGFLGLPASGVAAEMRVVDVYRRQGDRLAENWVLIDLP